ncbi:hypothetical protein PpBr36_03425 [Pyricularia pennisetigena]|uniref:hypothetical protein n=1 Tax=Pyricularia pennisetigena TaxID=1578925 RepID=UPI001152F8B9|nr:hypothetical protein PpBr36_03425 [Pyricularia pennisetigena]TLS30492.1 hypothetical protein PpBr36_03425 [Pyricularia pennisetigena]
MNNMLHNFRETLFGGTPRSRTPAPLDMNVEKVPATAPQRKRNAADDFLDTASRSRIKRGYGKASRRMYDASKSSPLDAVSAESSRLGFVRRSQVTVTVPESPHKPTVESAADDSIVVASDAHGAQDEDDADDDVDEPDAANDVSLPPRAGSIELLSSPSRSNRSSGLPKRGSARLPTPEVLESNRARNSATDEAEQSRQVSDAPSEAEDGEDGSGDKSPRQESEPASPAPTPGHDGKNIEGNEGNTAPDANDEDLGEDEPLEATAPSPTKAKSPRPASTRDDDDDDREEYSEMPEDGIVLLQPDSEAMPIVLYDDVSDERYTIRAILKHRPNEHVKHAFELQISWVGYKEPSWEPERSIQAQAPELLYKYWSDLGGRPETGAFRVFAVLRHWTDPGATRAKRGRPSKGKQAETQAPAGDRATTGRIKTKTKYEVQWEGYPNEKQWNSVETDMRLSKIAPEELAVYWEHFESRSKGENTE